MYYYLAVIREYFECDKYKKLYFEEKNKNEELIKKIQEIFCRINPDLIKECIE